MANQTVAPRVLPDLSAKDAEIAALRAQIAELSAKRMAGTVTMKVSEKGCLSLYGLNIRGVHLYASQWERILEHADKIAAFIAANPEIKNSQGERISGLARKVAAE